MNMTANNYPTHAARCAAFHAYNSVILNSDFHYHNRIRARATAITAMVFRGTPHAVAMAYLDSNLTAFNASINASLNGGMNL
tara:strand:+ start:2098 stop:2343 length:246 start_codon:yes stop_codon:yes gene_type:complete